MTERTYLEKVITETLRPIYGALKLLRQEITETMQIPDSPWKILNKPYDQLTEPEIMALFDVYHQEGETIPCPMCNWVARTELMKSRQDKKEGI
jgi:hypothetical protein